jgi:hypothetical protein
MQVRIRHPGQAAQRAGSDLRVTVTFRDDSLPLPLRIHFLHLKDDETGELELRNVGIELGDEVRGEGPFDEVPELTALTLRRVVERYPHWLELARAHALVPWEAPFDSIERQAKRPKPARLDPDWYRMIAVEYRHHVEADEPAPITAIAKSHGVTPSAASRWVKAARDKGLLDEGADDAR